MDGSDPKTNPESEKIVDTEDYFDADDASGHAVENNHAVEPEDNGFMDGNRRMPTLKSWQGDGNWVHAKRP